MLQKYIENMTLSYVFKVESVSVGLEGPRGFGPFHLKPKAHTEEEEVPGDEWRESKLPECTAEDDPVLGRPKSWEKKAPCYPRTSTRGSQKSHMKRIVVGSAVPGKAEAMQKIYA